MRDNQKNKNQGLPFPSASTELLGHEKAEGELVEAYNSGRMPHAWLFFGPTGIGKETLAFRLAKFILSQEGNKLHQPLSCSLFKSLTINPKCQAALQVSSESHPDLKILRCKSNEQGRTNSIIRINDIRSFKSSLHLKSSSGGWRVIIIDEAEKMNTNAANAILKLIEEPPEKTLVIIITNSLNAILPTIKSRCRKLMLRPLNDNFVASLITKVYPYLSDKDMNIILRLVEGSPGKALTFLEAGGAVIYRDIINILSKIPKISGEEVHALAENWCKRKLNNSNQDIFHIVTYMLLRWIERAILAANQSPDIQEIIPGDLEAGRIYVSCIGLESAFYRRDAIYRLIQLENALMLDRKQLIIEAFYILALGEKIEYSIFSPSARDFIKF
ncbi:ATPase involved in DNA replication [Candidatus Endolissoclinum faulkneri L2]|uniref:ATPase involved in DNA replication n=1 Tax=Candidatus Endolissoclinum faulkneri L2 TaxID=1193729 RepID=K7YHP9_9PROT|nr:DNA polymerase III subunit delta' [Candidatus Endolissoclinum faulkneri]AFX99110.1 ATPase involved in DNA replication [Candidatus Endolissoclinum faulkneri L2]